MGRRRRTPISSHPAAPLVTTLLTFVGAALFVVVTRRMGLWDLGKGDAMWSVILLAPVLFLAFFYDPITSALDRLVVRLGSERGRP